MAGFVFSGSVTVAEAAELFRSLQTVVAGVDVAACEPEDLQTLTAGVRVGQQAFDRLLIRIGAAAHRHEDEGRGRGAQATMLGDGSKVRGRTAAREAERAQTAANMDHVGAAVDDGRIGAAQVDAITQAAKGLTPEQRQELNTPDLVDAAATLPADSFARRARDEAERIKGDHGLADTKARQARSSWKHWIDKKSGMGRISAEFDLERHEAIAVAIDAQLNRLANQGGLKKNSNTAAEAAFQLLTGKARASSGLPHINVVVDYDTLQYGAADGSVRETAAGNPLPPESIARLACDAVLQRVVLSPAGIPVDVGHKHRTATDAQWHSLRAMYRTCAWANCDRPLTWCQAHHIHEWEHGGATDLCNLIPLCSQHHHAVHEGGWSVKLQPGSRRLSIFVPDDCRWAVAEPDRPRVPRRSRRSFSGDGDEPD